MQTVTREFLRRGNARALRIPSLLACLCLGSLAGSCGKPDNPKQVAENAKSADLSIPESPDGQAARLLESARGLAAGVARIIRESPKLGKDREPEGESDAGLSARWTELTGMHEQTFRLLSQAIEANPGDLQPWKAKAEVRWEWLTAARERSYYSPMLKEFQTKELEALFTDLQAYVWDPKDFRSFMLQGNAHLYGPRDWDFAPMKELVLKDALTRCDRAIADFTEAIRIAPGEPEAYGARARAFLWKARKRYDDPWPADRPPEAEVWGGEIGQDYEQAKKNAKHALFLSPQNERFKRLSDEMAEWKKRIKSDFLEAELFPVRSAKEVFERASPAVVLILATVAQGEAAGTGFFASLTPGTTTRFVLTNKHVIEGATGITLKLYDGRTFKATLVARHPQYDLALLRVSTASSEAFPGLTFHPEPPRTGEDVVLIGHPEGTTWSLTAGKVSQIRGSTSEPDKEIYLQTDAATNHGNSGGPLLNLRGLVVGIITFGIRDAEGLNFAVHKDVAIGFLKQYDK